MTEPKDREPLALIGLGGLGRIVVAMLQDIPSVTIAGFYDDSPDHACARRLLLRHLGPISGMAESCNVMVAIANPIVKREISLVVEVRGSRLAEAIVHPSAWVGGRSTIGDGSLVMPNASIDPDVTVGRSVCINKNCTIGHDTRIGDFVTVSPGTLVGGGVEIAEAVEIGLGAVLLPGVQIGIEARIGAGAVVTANVEPGSTVIGIPARPINSNTPPSRPHRNT